DNRLDHTLGTDRLGQLLKLVLVPVLARLILAGREGVHGQVAQDIPGAGLHHGRTGLGAKQRLQSATQASLLCRGSLAGRVLGCWFLCGLLAGRGLYGTHVTLSVMGGAIPCWVCPVARMRSRWRRSTSPARPR